MSTEAKGLGPEDSGDPESRLVWRLGHAGPWLASTLWVVLTACMLFDFAWIGTASSVGVITVFILMTRHDYNAVCIRCLREQPDDGGQQAQRRIWHLYAHHLPSLGLLGKVSVMFATVAAWIAGSIMSDSWIGKALTLLAGSYIAYDWYANYEHRRLKPWCPWCKDPGDNPDPVPERDPDPSMTKTA